MIDIIATGAIQLLLKSSNAQNAVRRSYTDKRGVHTVVKNCALIHFSGTLASRKWAAGRHAVLMAKRQVVLFVGTSSTT